MNLFQSARTKLTLFYLTIIMVISIFFSFIIYRGATAELNRIENMQRVRKPNPQFVIDPDIIIETKARIFFSLLSLNAIILCVSGLSGYFLAGKTLNPIAKMMDDQKDFVSNASHELRTPLSALKSQIEVALRSKSISTKEAKDILKSNLEDVNNMVSLSNYLLKLNKFQLENNKLDFKKIELSKIIIKVAKDKNIKLDLDKSIVKVNEDSIYELISILVDNAVKYGENKEVFVTLKNKVLKIKDNGIGISDSDLPHIFDRFYRGDKARSHDGYGLGLSIAKQIADIHSAKIKVESKLGVGTTFKVIFS
jgi:signal transduction histidine kinase